MVKRKIQITSTLARRQQIQSKNQEQATVTQATEDSAPRTELKDLVGHDAKVVRMADECLEFCEGFPLADGSFTAHSMSDLLRDDCPPWNKELLEAFVDYFATRDRPHSAKTLKKHELAGTTPPPRRIVYRTLKGYAISLVSVYRKVRGVSLPKALRQQAFSLALAVAVREKLRLVAKERVKLTKHSILELVHQVCTMLIMRADSLGMYFNTVD